ncbi:FkbM family methyltransferase [Limnohabitans sp. WS1]|uniref:FkbM family methyltransferase n=1 Tax=Limnohabitans sp. WS1 TaxID=1100726 RepID=UPI000D39F021|nr:FkbM family methyltransferase [Limnohabitans sp. WS1]PUE17938.1 hypothetical protein B9Z48_10150 [Limnohabitans sp. WS1]
MKTTSLPHYLRNFLWRLGRKIYIFARGDGQNEPRTNGEYWLLKETLKSQSSPSVLLDVGANKGNWSTEALKISTDSHPIQIHAFEPSLATRLLLIGRFHGSNAVTVQPYALSDSIGEATFYSEEEGGGTNSLSPVSGRTAENVQVNTVDRFVEENSIQAISMMKVDTEGFDLFVLRGAVTSLSAGLIEVIQFEYNWRWLLNHACLRDIFDLIADKPYRFGKLVGESIEFYDEWHFEFDRFFENNYVLVRNDSALGALGTPYTFDEANVGVRG